MATGRQQACQLYQAGGGLKHPRIGSQHSGMGPSPKRTEKSPAKAGDKVNTLVGELHILGLPSDSCCPLVFIILVEEPLPTAATASGRVFCFVVASILNLNLKRKKNPH